MFEKSFEKSDEKFISMLKNPALRESRLRRLTKPRKLTSFAMIAVLIGMIIEVFMRSFPGPIFVVLILLIVIHLNNEQTIKLIKVYELLSHENK